MRSAVRGRFFGQAVGVGTLALVAMIVASAPAMACSNFDGMAKNFGDLYPTGGEAARFDGERGRKVMGGLATDAVGDEVVFLYSGNGPVTGARGRYMYLVLDPSDCILDSDWIDGDSYDHATTVE